ncbi:MULTISPECIES: hypothetical protein [unclassified Pantoea]|uniref:hypothetical protein n=1 Tax=unclassified Pantoea TaxID=2630326 RepID=UPI0021574B61|nr:MULTISPECIES: hypothetical protein [unclassified Pantoea]MEA5101291.1 hypothetical protein [Pantoea sp. S18]UVC31496.1 hypothetical protein NR302_22110 [Pantoea sp. SOD02]
MPNSDSQHNHLSMRQRPFASASPLLKKILAKQAAFLASEILMQQRGKCCFTQSHRNGIIASTPESRLRTVLVHCDAMDQTVVQSSYNSHFIHWGQEYVA